MTESTALQRFRLDGRRVLVTGATGHLGEPIARLVAAAGGLPVLAGRTLPKLEALAQAISATGALCETLVFDVGSPPRMSPRHGRVNPQRRRAGRHRELCLWRARRNG